MARMCPNHKIATFFANQKCGKIFKKPHKMTFAKIFCVDFEEFRGKSVETGVKNPHKTHFTFQKRVKRGKSKRLETLVYKKISVFHIYTLFKMFLGV